MEGSTSVQQAPSQYLLKVRKQPLRPIKQQPYDKHTTEISYKNESSKQQKLTVGERRWRQGRHGSHDGACRARERRRDGFARRGGGNRRGSGISGVDARVGDGALHAYTVVLPKIPHCNSSKSVPNRPLWGRRGRFGTLLQQLEYGIFGRTAVSVPLKGFLLKNAYHFLQKKGLGGLYPSFENCLSFAVVAAEFWSLQKKVRFSED